MLIDANLTPKLWPYAAHYAVLIYNHLPHSTLNNYKSPVVFVMLFNRQSFYISWRKDQQKDSFLISILLATQFWTYKVKLPM